MWTGDPVRFLAVLVVATPLLIGIPVAIIGAISLAAKRSIIIRDHRSRSRRPMPDDRRQDWDVDLRRARAHRAVHPPGIPVAN
jgi:hypothetical protein